MIRSLLLIILPVLTFISCDKVITISIPEESNKVVLNLLMNKDSIMMARITLSGRLEGPKGLPEITNAEVKLYENGVFREMLTPFTYRYRTFYRGTTLAKTGATYRVTAEIPGYPEISGSDQIPDTVQVGEMRLTAGQVSSSRDKVTISVQLHDDPAIQNYYRIRLYGVNEGHDSTGNGWRSKAPQEFEAEEASLKIYNKKARFEFYTTDALFNGKSPRFVFTATTYNYYNKMAVEITTLTYNSYNYLNSAAMADEKNEDGFSEKVIVFNNIENGLGIVGGVAQREYDLAK
ncbi:MULTISPECIES: DUF4249 domain-containing protein [Niastella]|uniref:DUF4249 domain-containing protein n=1 Tax=Niastella soli TaxID=2821487 RepID=A0ABS3YVR6_9BACT|nr:DUF4249 domain-containing protein [Niastella soli]MBO9202026.1 DUF4249 domain-containing protein [Niastella soli]